MNTPIWTGRRMEDVCAIGHVTTSETNLTNSSKQKKCGPPCPGAHIPRWGRVRLTACGVLPQVNTNTSAVQEHCHSILFRVRCARKEGTSFVRLQALLTQRKTALGTIPSHVEGIAPAWTT
ncbi:hypothetical protein CH063_02237, partial [Colletotrichum higginsianum]